MEIKFCIDLRTDPWTREIDVCINRARCIYSTAMSSLEEDEDAEHRSKRQRPEGPEAIILFLAHAGVAQGRLWEAWKRPVGSRIAFVVHTGGNEVKGDDFVTAHAAPLYIKSGWGDMDSVLAYQEGLCHVLDTYPSAKMIHFVSGSDIPLCSAEHLLATVTDTLFALAADRHGQAIRDIYDFWEPVDVSVGTETRRIRLVVTHRAGHALSREDASALVRCDMATPSNLLHEKSGIMYDEFVPAVMLSAFHRQTPKKAAWLTGDTDDDDKTTGAHASDNHYSNCTMVADEKRNTHGALYTTMDDLQEKTGRSLRAALWKMSKDAVFFRKIGPGVDFFKHPHVLPWMQSDEEKLDTAFVLDVVSKCGTALKGPYRPAPGVLECFVTPNQYRALLAQYQALDWDGPKSSVTIGVRIGAYIKPLYALRSDDLVGSRDIWKMTISFNLVPRVELVPESEVGGAIIVKEGPRIVAPLWTDAILPFLNTVPLRQARRRIQPYLDAMGQQNDRTTVTFGVKGALEHPSNHGTCVLQ